ncbi:MAG: hypothetical protein GTN99_03180 [Candidatus Dadabacteria bacterium]|nr:hypothetical protein [Candidatus Dadabacteria bacterium]NIT13263.1 hypothetical protein [Candidatus Dadabacteria bacterium]
MSKLPAILIGLLIIFTFINPSRGEQLDSELVIKYVSSYNIDALRELGPDVMPILSDLYKVSDVKQKRVIANIFYQLGIQSQDAKDALMQDVKTTNKQLRISVQYALGRVSSDTEVVDALLHNMHYDDNAYFRDKAACALAYDQIHLTDEQKVSLYEGLIQGLSSPNTQVRSIAIKALKIHTGQTKGFLVNGTSSNQSESLRKWHEWLEEYKSNL